MAKPPQATKGCPNCGSKGYRLAPLRMEDTGKLVAMRDHICNDCGARYIPPMPGSVPYIFMMVGMCLAVLGIGAMFVGEILRGPVKLRLWMKAVLAAAGLIAITTGIQLACWKKP